MAAKSNREILTGGKKYVTKQAKKFGVNEVVFDKDLRKEYLTGFHKRKLQRKKKAQEFIKEQERLARVQERKQLREERKKDLENQLESFNETVQKITNYSDDDDDDWLGFTDKKKQKSQQESEETPAKGILNHTEVYHKDENVPVGEAIIEDETEVVVESLENPRLQSVREANLEAIARSNNVDLAKSEEVLEKSIKRAKDYAVVCGVAPSVKDKIKTKKKKFRYLTKTERRENNRKVKLSKLKSRKRD